MNGLFHITAQATIDHLVLFDQRLTRKSLMDDLRLKMPAITDDPHLGPGQSLFDHGLNYFRFHSWKLYRGRPPVFQVNIENPVLGDL